MIIFILKKMPSVSTMTTDNASIEEQDFFPSEEIILSIKATCSVVTLFLDEPIDNLHRVSQ
jgi:hypothetical protein